MENLSQKKTFKSFREFWPFYLGQHLHAQCRILHFLGTSVAATLILVAVLTGTLRWLLPALMAGYGFAWWGHFAFEKNKPATFRYPLYSFLGDWKMFWMMLQGTLENELKRWGYDGRGGGLGS